MKTKYGNTSIDTLGYYIITGGIYKWQYLHKIIYENIFGSIPKNCIIHHIDNNKLNNEPTNLQCMTRSFHKWYHDYFWKEDISIKLSKSKQKSNSSGYYRVIKIKDKTYKQGFIWSYQYMLNKRQRKISAVSLKKLKKKVLKAGFTWIKF